MHPFIKPYAFILLVAAAPAVTAQNEAQLEVHAISGGGGKASGGTVTLSGTIGQAIGGAASGGVVEIKSGFHPASLELLLPDPDGSFQAWMDGLPESEKPPLDQRGPLDEPANDGVSNLLKYALGLLPLRSSPDATPRVVIVPAPDAGNVVQNYLGIEFKRSADAVVLTEVEKSGALSGWTTTPFTTSVLEGPDAQNRELVRLLTGLLVKDDTRHFLRLKIRVAPTP